ncbi:hypothetical protein PR048_022250 [Dryococelus australis]|uniref:HAT C-terminal dimerisation domain-containing protein n=1 Tax=Dryococelus australis TaxID=614101 RepID=A0ABQ9H0R4_9NEOP|nr:hypothetical protein PR048_022250 [Dryococelus australis]
MLDPIVSALEYLNDLPGDHSKKASVILNNICTASLLTALAITSKLLGLTCNLSKYLQKENLDLFSAVNQVSEIKAVIQKLRNNAENEFNELFVGVQQMSSCLHVNNKVPRITGTQRHRPNPQFSTDPESYYRTTAYITCIDDISSLTVRLLINHETISSLHFVFCAYCDVPFEKIRNVFDFYKEDLKDTYEDAFKGEWDIWKQKWNGIEEKPTCAIDSLAKCDRHLFPNVYILLKILAVLPVSTASAERSFSNMILIKSYLRSTISENRLKDLCLSIESWLSKEVIVNFLTTSLTQELQGV